MATDTTEGSATLPVRLPSPLVEHADAQERTEGPARAARSAPMCHGYVETGQICGWLRLGFLGLGGAYTGRSPLMVTRVPARVWGQ